MRRIKVVSTLAALAAATVFATALHAYPAPGDGQETYVTYYTDSSHSDVVGVRAIAHSSNCGPYHISWGSTSSFSVVTVGSCLPIDQQ